MARPLERVLLIEDEDDIRQLAQMALELSGTIQVRACADGEEALAAVAEFRPQLVLSDMMMPGMDGAEVLRRLRADPETADIPFVFLTAKVRHEEVGEFLKQGAASVIPKPFDPVKLAAQVQEIWARMAG